MRSNMFMHSSKSRWYMLQAFCTRRAMVKSLIMHAFHQRFYISHSYFLNICHKLHFNRHVDLICTEVRRVVWPSRPMCSIYATVYETVLCMCVCACNTTTILIVPSLEARGTLVRIYERPRVNAFYTMHNSKPRDLYLPMRGLSLHTGDNGTRRENNSAKMRDTARALRKTSPWISQSVLRARDSWVESRLYREMCLSAFMRKWQIRIAGEQHRASWPAVFFAFVILTGLRLFILSVLAKVYVIEGSLE